MRLRSSIAVAILALPYATSVVTGQTQTKRPKFDAFEVATIKPSSPDGLTAGRYIRMQSGRTFQAKNTTVSGLIAAAYDLTPRAISGGPTWVESDRYEIIATTPGDIRPTYDEQMAMLRQLLTERFHLGFHREKKDFAILEIAVAKGGPKLEKLKPSTLAPDDAGNVTSTVFPASSGGIDHVLMPARNASMAQFASVFQRAIFDLPVVDKTGLPGRYDFDLSWTPDDTQFGGQLPRGAPDHPQAGLFEAVQQQLGLTITATRGPIETLVIDRIDHPTEN